VSVDGTFGSSVTSMSSPIGSLTDHEGLNKTFHGSRIRKGNETVNQSISLSFDPNNLTCVSCATEHPIGKTKPVTVFFSDQNFVSRLEGVGQSCLTVVRMEDATLSELYELSRELFGNVKFLEGSVFLYGSSSYLSRVGTGVSASDWLSVISHVSGTWPGIRVCPLIPLINSEVPGSLARELSELAAWLAIVYDNNPLGMQAPWAAVVSASEALSVGATKLPNMDTYKVLLPQGIDAGATLSSMTFCSVSSRPANLKGLPKDTSLELVRSLHIDSRSQGFPNLSEPGELSRKGV
jgi:hypothetical protein